MKVKKDGLERVRDAAYFTDFFGSTFEGLKHLVKIMSPAQVTFLSSLAQIQRQYDFRKHDEEPEETYPPIHPAPEGWFACTGKDLKEFGWNASAQAKYLKGFARKGWISTRRGASIPSYRIIRLEIKLLKDLAKVI